MLNKNVYFPNEKHFFNSAKLDPDLKFQINSISIQKEQTDSQPVDFGVYDSAAPVAQSFLMTKTAINIKRKTLLAASIQYRNCKVKISLITMDTTEQKSNCHMKTFLINR